MGGANTNGRVDTGTVGKGLVNQGHGWLNNDVFDALGGTLHRVAQGSVRFAAAAKSVYSKNGTHENTPSKKTKSLKNLQKHILT